MKDTFDMAYEITKLIKKSPKSESEFHRKQAEFLGQIESGFHVYNMDSPILKTSAQQGGLSELHL